LRFARAFRARASALQIEGVTFLGKDRFQHAREAASRTIPGRGRDDRLGRGSWRQYNRRRGSYAIIADKSRFPSLNRLDESRWLGFRRLPKPRDG
jgi:hypothetical protein